MFKTFLVDQFTIRTDGDMVNLNDLYVAAGSQSNKSPYEWSRLPETKRLIDELCNNHNTEKSRIYRTTKGKGGGTWAHKLLAVDYAGYLSPEFKIKVNDTFLRVQEGDDSVIDEAFERQSKEQQKRTAARLNGKVARNLLTDTLKGRGTQLIYAKCTNATYEELFDANADGLRKQLMISKNDNPRDHFDLGQLIATSMAEWKSSKKIDEDDVRGDKNCVLVCRTAAQQVRSIL